MNAKTLERLVAFREKGAFEVVKKIISQKIKYQFSVVKARKRSILYLYLIKQCNSSNELFLIEARAAREYWSLFKERISGKAEWLGRTPHGQDICNKYLDIGYHYLVQMLARMFQEIDLPVALGLYHKAQSKNARPLIYDFMEWLRPITVDALLLKLLRRKKRQVTALSAKEIGKFVFMIKELFGRKYFHRKLGYCITLEYWTRLVALALQSSINNRVIFAPIFPSLRHETRGNRAIVKV